MTGVGTFASGTGAVTLTGDVATASGKDLHRTGAGTFASGTGAVTLNGEVAIASGMDVHMTGRSLGVSTGQLKEGLGSAAVYTAADGELQQQAGLCGTLSPQQYEQEASLAGSASLAAAGDTHQSLSVATAVVSAVRVHHRRIENGECADAHSLDWLSLCPRSLIVSIGQLRGFVLRS